MYVRCLALLMTMCGLVAAEPINFLAWSPPSTNDLRDLGEFLRSLREELKLPGVAAAVVKEGRIVAAGVAGVRKWGGDDSVRIEDQFHIGSCTKSVTALLGVMNHEQIPLDTRMPDVFPEWEFPDDAEKITFRLLLQNRSGLGNKPDPQLWARAFLMSGPSARQRERFLRDFLKKPVDAEPGTKFIYSNVGYALAGAMLEKRVGKAWEEMVREEIFKPLHLESGGFGAPEKVSGHQFKDGAPAPIPPHDNPLAIAPAGAIHMSILDLARYTALHLAIARGEVATLKDQVAVLYSPPEGSDYALGWNVANRAWAGGKVLTHSGSNTMFHSVIWIALEKNFAIVVSTNIGDRTGSAVAEKCDAIVSALILRIAGK